MPRRGLIDRRLNLSNAIGFGSCLIFLLSGLAIVRYPGIQYDEALFTAPLYPPRWDTGGISIFHIRIPLMLMTYLGCLKTWLYKPIFLLWSPSIYSLRIPAILIGLVTVYLFWILLRETVGQRAALVGALLLATDSSFLLTTCFDWGPVALQHLLLVAGVLALVCFYKNQNEKLLALGFFIFGLGLWDKALFSWTLAGLLCSTLVVFPREVMKLLNWRSMAIAGVFLVLGSSPLILYNLQQPGITFRSNTNFSLKDFDLKFGALKHTTDGSALFGYMVRQDATHERAAETALERFAVWLNHLTGERRENYIEFAFLAALVAVPFLWRTSARKPISFALVFLGVVWTQMVITMGAGTGAHHVVLMWPLPMFLIGAAFAELSRRIRAGKLVLVAAVFLLAATNLAVTNQYLAQLIRFGPTGGWDDAIFRLATYLQGRRSNDIYVADWGMLNPLRLLDRGTLRIHEICFTLEKSSWDNTDKQSISDMLSNMNSLIIIHTTAFEAYSGINARLASIVANNDDQEDVITTISDSSGHAVFEVLRLGKSK
jgi:4-amino-4-deoxy-L-arabinose transferase-like glycosyltransferase